MKKILALVMIAAAGVFTAAHLPASARASQQWTVDQLPSLGYSVGFNSLGSGCHGWQAGYGNAAKTDLGSDCDPGFQSRLDAFVSSTCPCAQTNEATTAPATTGMPPSTTAATTALAPVLPPATTTIVQTIVQPAETTTVAVTTTVTPVEQSLQAQIDALAAQLASLTDRVSRLEKAGDAAWLAFQQAVTNGEDVATAADLARGTYLNALYGLGVFAP